MNLSKLQLKNVLGALKYGDQLRPMRDWLVLLLVTFLLLVGSLLWNLWLFAQVTAGEPIGNAPATPELGAPAIDTVEQLFTARSQEEANYKGVYRFVDPSI